MAESFSFWQRVSSVFRGPGLVGDGNGRRAGAAAGPEAGGALELAPRAAAPRWWQRRRSQPQMREVALRIGALADAMQRHFEEQDRHAAELAGALERIGGVLERLGETQRGQADFLRTIATQTEAAGRHSASLAAAIGQIPESLLTQAEAIRTVARQVELAQESDVQLMHALQSFGRAVDTLGSAGTAQVTALTQLQAAQRAQHEAFQALVQAQGRRFLLLLGLAAAVVVPALAVLGAVLAGYVFR